MTFQEWLSELDSVAKAKYGFGRDLPPLAQQTGEDCWRIYYERGETPEGAIIEELSNA